MRHTGKGRLRPADWFLILLLLLCLGGIILRDHGERATAPSVTDTRILTLEWRDADARTVALLQPGALLYDADGEPYGELLTVEATPAVAELWEGGVCHRGIPSETPRRDVRLSVLVRGYIRDGIFYRTDRDLPSVGSVKILTNGIVEFKANTVKMIENQKN